VRSVAEALKPHTTSMNVPESPCEQRGHAAAAVLLVLVLLLQRVTACFAALTGAQSGTDLAISQKQKAPDSVNLRVRGLNALVGDTGFEPGTCSV
jgi:hypothetical protein